MADQDGSLIRELFEKTVKTVARKVGATVEEVQGKVEEGVEFLRLAQHIKPVYDTHRARGINPKKAFWLAAQEFANLDKDSEERSNL